MKLLTLGIALIFLTACSYTSGEESRAKFEQKCRDVGFTDKQCVFFEKGRNAP